MGKVGRRPTNGRGQFVEMAKRGPLPPMAQLGDGIFTKLDQRLDDYGYKPSTLSRRGLSDEDAVTRNPTSRNSEETPRRPRMVSVPDVAAARRNISPGEHQRPARNCPSPRGHQRTLDVDLQLPGNCKLLGYLGRIQDELKAVVQHGEPCIPPEHFLSEPVLDPLPPHQGKYLAMEDAEDPTESLEMQKSTLAHSRRRSRSMPARPRHRERIHDEDNALWREDRRDSGGMRRRMEELEVNPRWHEDPKDFRRIPESSEVKRLEFQGPRLLPIEDYQADDYPDARSKWDFCSNLRIDF